MNTPTAAPVATTDSQNPRIATVTRNTAETKISVRVNLDGTGRAKLSTADPSTAAPPTSRLTCATPAIRASR